MERTQDSNMFNLQKSEEITLGDLRLTDRNDKTPQKQPKTYVEKFDQERPPLSVLVKPYVQAFLSGAHKTAGVASDYGQKAMGVVSAAFWWGVAGIKSLFQKTVEYVQPKFVLLTNKKEPNQEQLGLIAKLQRDKEMAVVGINELNELKPMSGDGKIRVTVPADQEFLEYLKNEKFKVKQERWVEQADPTKTIVMPSMSFVAIVNTLEKEGQDIPKKEVFNYGNFCVFEMQGKNQIEYDFLEKLRMSKDHLEGYILQAKEIRRNDSSESKSDNQGMLVNQSQELPETLTPEELKFLAQKPEVLVKEVPLKVVEVPLVNPNQEESRQLELA